MSVSQLWEFERQKHIFNFIFNLFSLTCKDFFHGSLRLFFIQSRLFNRMCSREFHLISILNRMSCDLVSINSIPKCLDTTSGPTSFALDKNNRIVIIFEFAVQLFPVREKAAERRSRNKRQNGRTVIKVIFKSRHLLDNCYESFRQILEIKKMK